ncbi:MAG: cation diffusion facilitator family transporter, partial [Desulfovibrionaceae bacterium]|nr:cation diffusion facilitator family transporter [Desulfovibrionaceae bacterium]
MTDTTPTPEKEKQRAAQNSLFCAIGLTVLKLAAGVATNSLGILSEALHSSLDLLAAAITLFAVKMASRPADRQHPYGYGKIENLSALAETLLLLVTCGWVVREAVDRLFFESPAVYPSWWGAGVIAIAMLVDISRARMLHKVAAKHKSQALEADALHFSTDIWSSAVVLAGLACVWISTLLPPRWTTLIHCLRMGDAAAALVVSAIVIFVGLKLSNKAVNALLDGGGLAQTEKLEKALAERLPGCAIHRLRVRESGAKAFVDLTAETPAVLPVEAAHALSDQIEAVICGIVPGADVTVHIEPAKNSGVGVLAATQAMAAAYALAIHNVTLSRQKNDGSLIIFLHVETPPDMTLEEAHRRVDRFENEMHEKLAASVVTHIEPCEQN